ncbi:hypothetical protein IA539_22685 [Gordonia sp. zg691]|uniref:hypothetical protein n=1 Tax=Gordonia jinghuaiqii TaxID=2758710 RepID=UPI001662497C|nr:hypothetical protein [Gordonia jinghuaiqii]MBD0863982.1 hypothetical protein [Gordonia jinghuaiqii]
MTSTLSVRASRRGARKFLEPSAIVEAIDIEELIVLPGYRALSELPSSFGVTVDIADEIDAALRRHQAVVGHLRTMLSDATAAAAISSPRDEALASIGLLEADREVAERNSSPPVRVYGALAADLDRADDGRARVMVAVAFLLVATHALTDPTNCGTASPALNLVPPPLHRDRALLEKVLTRVVSMFDATTLAGLAGHITAASAAFAEGSDADRQLSVLRYNPHSLRTSCRAAGMGDVDVRIAG